MPEKNGNKDVKVWFTPTFTMEYMKEKPPHTFIVPGKEYNFPNGNEAEIAAPGMAGLLSLMLPFGPTSVKVEAVGVTRIEDTGAYTNAPGFTFFPAKVGPVEILGLMTKEDVEKLRAMDHRVIVHGEDGEPDDDPDDDGEDAARTN